MTRRRSQADVLVALCIGFAFGWLLAGWPV
jgi:hypothetical protein